MVTIPSGLQRKFESIGCFAVQHIHVRQDKGFGRNQLSGSSTKPFPVEFILRKVDSKATTVRDIATEAIAPRILKLNSAFLALDDKFCMGPIDMQLAFWVREFSN